MSIFKGPGIMLNPVTVQQPNHLPKLFDLALNAQGANLCGVKDELGAIAHSLHENGKTDEGNKLFGILESEYALTDMRDDILSCINGIEAETISNALVRSGRFFREGEDDIPIRGRQSKFSDTDAITALCNHRTQKAAAKALGISRQAVSDRIARAAEDSALAVFKGVFTKNSRKGVSQKVSDDDIAAELPNHDTITAAARTLDVTPKTVYNRIADADENSPLHAFKGVFEGGFKEKLSDDEIAAELPNHDTITAAAETLGITPWTVYVRIANSDENSPLHAFKGVFKTGSKKKVSDDEIAAELANHNTITAAARALSVCRMTLSRRIARAGEDSPLHAYKGVFKGGVEEKVSDDEIAEELAYHDTIAATAKALDLNTATIYRRIANADEDSPLHAFKGVFKRGVEKKVSDDEIAAAIIEHGTYTAAARVLGVTRGTVYRRIAHAAKDSPLYPFKRKK